MSFLLDTDTCSVFVRRPARLSHRFIQHAGNLATSSITVGELFTWVYRRSDPQKLVATINAELLNEVTVLDFDSKAAMRFGQVRADLLTAGTTVEPADLMIAAVALEHDLTLVTHNTRHFAPIPDLRLEDWLSE